ncbi:hypothetical protein GV819_20615 [Pseudomonas sp. Fl5BN2]|nr:hypothetical protein [Pseudomonas sp. Fl5BN2]
MCVHGIEYKFYCASSAIKGHDGLGLECWESDKRMLFEIFRNDETLRYEVTLFEQELLEREGPRRRTASTVSAVTKRSTVLSDGISNPRHVFSVCQIVA